jgi:hypothetical protein
MRRRLEMEEDVMIEAKHDYSPIEARLLKIAFIGRGVAAPPNRRKSKHVGPRNYRHASSEADYGNIALRLRILLQVNRRVSLTTAKLHQIRIAFEAERLCDSR